MAETLQFNLLFKKYKLQFIVSSFRKHDTAANLTFEMRCAVTEGRKKKKKKTREETLLKEELVRHRPKT